MEDWKEYKLGEIANFTTGKLNSNAAEENGVYPFFTCSPETLKINSYAFELDAILLAGNNAEGNFSIKRYNGKFNAYQRTYVITAKDESIVDIDYLFYALKLCLYHFKTISQGTATKFLTAVILNNFPITLPPLPTQQKIAQILSSLDDKIELNNKINANLEQQAQALFKEFYKKSIKNVNFTDVVEILGGGTPKTDISEYWNGDIPFFTPKDVENPYCLSTEKKLTEEGLNNCNSRLYPKNTIFVTARGTVGKVCLAGIPMAMNQSCYALKSKGMNQFLAYFYTLETINSLKHKANGATFDAIVTRDFETENIKLLSEEDSKKIENIVEPIFNAILTNQSENRKLAMLRDTLLPKLISGELEVN